MREPRTNRLLWLVLGGAAILFLGLCLIALVASAPAWGGGLALSSGQIALLELQGIILDSRDFTGQLKLFGGRSGIKAVLIRINSPGGGVAASQEIYEAVRKFRADTGKKVVVSMSAVAASGGYYVACAADRIYANPGTITGSIGVIAEWVNYGALLKWAKLDDVVIKSGELKDAGSPTRPLTEAERAYFQTLIDDMHRQFVAAVASGRKMQPEALRPLADGRVFTGSEAKANGLVDELGTLQDAVAGTARLVGIKGEPRLLEPPEERRSLLDLLLGSSRLSLPLPQEPSGSSIRFQYLWR